ncbi:hypothetical protein KC571_01720 [candidate division WWE3 bacterium]|uniref:Uncharacterized protein n=1 Tax=candidate division WWE3 bacterium TaxID=2053526 RepID=A0A955LHY3_UNCKA|nr:hypothetical protein [candidate division WWE3 bacterium]
MTNKFKKHALQVASAMGLLGLTAGNAYAQAIPTISLAPPSAGFTNFGSLISTGLTIVFIVAGLAVLIYLFIGALTYLTAGDNEDSTKKARLMITNAVVGLIILAASWAIWQLIINFVPGLNSLVGQS